MYILMLVLEFIDEGEFIGGFCGTTVLLKGIFDELVGVCFYCLAGREEPLWGIQKVQVTKSDTCSSDQ